MTKLAFQMLCNEIGRIGGTYHKVIYSYLMHIKEVYVDVFLPDRHLST